jgi:hypothetical protein
MYGERLPRTIEAILPRAPITISNSQEQKLKMSFRDSPKD